MEHEGISLGSGEGDGLGDGVAAMVGDGKTEGVAFAVGEGDGVGSIAGEGVTPVSGTHEGSGSLSMQPANRKHAVNSKKIFFKMQHPPLSIKTWGI